MSDYCEVKNGKIVCPRQAHFKNNAKLEYKFCLFIPCIGNWKGPTEFHFLKFDSKFNMHVGQQNVYGE